MSVLIKLNLVIIAIIALVDVIWGNMAGFAFPPADHYYWSLLLATVFGAAGLFYTYVRIDPKIAAPCWSLFTYATFMPTAIFTSYLSASLNYPLADGMLAQMDAMLGFSWPDAINWFVTLPDWVSTFSTRLYASTLWGMFIVACFLIFTGRHRQMDEYVTLFVVTCTITSIIAGFLPGQNAYEFFRLDPSIYEKLSPAVGQSYMQDFFALRDGSLRQLKLVGVQGLVSFPSFHTILALILIYVMRGSGIFFAIAVVWNVGIILTTPFDGAHYLTDVIGGFLVMGLSMALIRWAEPRAANLFSRQLAAPGMVPQPQ